MLVSGLCATRMEAPLVDPPSARLYIARTRFHRSPEKQRGVGNTEKDFKDASISTLLGVSKKLSEGCTKRNIEGILNGNISI